MKNSAILRLLLKGVGLPAVGAAGLWLVSEYPAVHSALCSSGY